MLRRCATLPWLAEFPSFATFLCHLPFVAVPGSTLYDLHQNWCPIMTDQHWACLSTRLFGVCLPQLHFPSSCIHNLCVCAYMCVCAGSATLRWVVSLSVCGCRRKLYSFLFFFLLLPLDFSSLTEVNVLPAYSELGVQFLIRHRRRGSHQRRWVMISY